MPFCSIICDLVERHDFWSRFLLFIPLFFFPLFLGEKRKGKRITKVVVKSHAFLLDPSEHTSVDSYLRESCCTATGQITQIKHCRSYSVAYLSKFDYFIFSVQLVLNPHWIAPTFLKFDSWFYSHYIYQGNKLDQK